MRMTSPMYSLRSHWRWQPLPHLQTIVYGHHILSHRVSMWGSARCGHHNFADGRSARHRGVFCASAADSLDHTLSQCLRAIKRENAGINKLGGQTPSVNMLFSIAPAGNTARNTAQHFLCGPGHVCHAAVDRASRCRAQAQRWH